MPDVDLRSIARGTPGFSGADLANLVNEAALLAARAGRLTVGNGDLDAARDKVLMGVERKSVAMSEHERITCAYHEAGHAVVAALLPDADPLHKVTIIPRGRALGVTMQLPEADRYTHSKPFIEAQIAILMGGRVAEELFLRQMTSGASNDIERATELARKMVCELGMSPLGPVHFRRPASGFENDNRAAGFSEETARRVDDEIRALVMRGYETARQIVERQRDGGEGAGGGAARGRIGGRRSAEADRGAARRAGAGDAVSVVVGACPSGCLIVGLGPIGASVARQVIARKGFKLVGAVDVDPAKVGRDAARRDRRGQAASRQGDERHRPDDQVRQARRRRALHQFLAEVGRRRSSKKSSSTAFRSSPPPRKRRIPRAPIAGWPRASTRRRARRRSRCSAPASIPASPWTRCRLR